MNPQKLCNEIPGQEVDTYLFEFKNDTSFSFNLDDGKLAAVTVFTYSPSYSGGNFTYGTDEEDFIILTELCNQLGDVVAFEQYAERPGEQILVIDSEPG